MNEPPTKALVRDDLFRPVIAPSALEHFGHEAARDLAGRPPLDPRQELIFVELLLDAVDRIHLDSLHYFEPVCIAEPHRWTTLPQGCASSAY